MKKLAILGASAALAAMPVVGVFADGDPIDVTSKGVKDVITLGISESCTMTVPAGTAETDSTEHIYGTNVSLEAIAPGNDATEKPGTVMSIKCNSDNGWALSARASALDRTDSKYNIPFGQFATTGQTASVWSARLALGGQGAVIAGGADAYNTTTINSSDTTVVVKNSTLNGSTDTTPVATDNTTVSPYYKAHASTTQAEGSYSGDIVYTFTATPGA